MVKEVSWRCHIMMVTHVLPYPPAAGNEIRIFRMLQWLKASGHRVTLILKPLGDEEVSNECIAGLNPVVDDLFVFDARYKPVDSGRLAFRLDEAEARHHLGDMQGGFCPPWFAEEVDALLQRLQPDVLISQYIFMSRILLTDSASRMLKVIDTHDLFCKKRETVEKYGIENFGLMMSEDDEATLFRRADVLLAIQRIELDVINRLVPERKALLTGFDVDIFHSDPALRVPGVVLVVASSNEFNVRGTQDFLDFVWPLIRERYPDARLRMIGKVCNHVRTRDASVEMLGFVQDLSLEYQRASVVVNPCGVGTGLKIKTVEALAWGKPHVGWPASADGLRELGPLPYVVATDAVEFADAVTELLSDPMRAASLSQAAHAFAECHLGAAATYGSLAETISAHVAERM